jgi:predicted ArsR family transcriptional regulator
MVANFQDLSGAYRSVSAWLKERGFHEHRRFYYLKTSEAIILARLIEGETEASELAQKLAIDRPGISRNVMYLRDRGLVIDIAKWRLKLRGVMSDAEFQRYTTRGRAKRVAVRTRYDEGPDV